MDKFFCVKLEGELTHGESLQPHVDPERGERWQEHPLFGDQGQESSILVGQSEETFLNLKGSFLQGLLSVLRAD